MSLISRIKAAEEAAIITLESGWRIKARDLLPGDFAAHDSANDLAAWLAFNRGDLLTLRTIEEGGPDAAELRQEWQAEVQRRQADPESQLRAARLQRAALLSSVVGMAAPGEEIGPVQLVADGPPVQVVGDLEIIPLRTFAGLVGPVGYAEAADILLLRAVGGEAGQKAALAFRGLRRSLMAGQARKGIQLSPVGSAEGEHPGSPGGSPVLDAGGGGAGEDRA